MAQKDIGNKVPLHTLKKTEDVMKFYDDWGKENKYDKDMSDWNYTGPKETSEVFNKYANDKEIKIYDHSERRFKAMLLTLRGHCSQEAPLCQLSQ